MSGKQDKKLPSNNHDVDFSVIRTAIQIGGKSIEQILNGVHYGSAEVRHLLMNECDFILECKVCHNLFRSLPNFVAHKRVYCVEFYEEHKFNLLQKEKEGETIIVQPQPPPPSPPQKPNEAGSVMTINKTTFGKNETNDISSVMDEVLSGKFKGKSQAYNLYTQLAEKVEQQKETRMVKQVTLSPIPSTSCAMRLDMKEVELEGSSAFVEDTIETDQVGTGSSQAQSSGSLLETKRSHIQRLCDKLAASTGSKIAGDESHAGNQNFEPSLTKKKVYETRTRSDTPENHSNSTGTESPSKNHNLEDSPTKRKTREGRTSRDIQGIRMDVINSMYTEIHSGNDSLAAASTRSKARESRTRTPDSAVILKSSTSSKDQDANQSLEVSAAKRKINMARTKKDTFNDANSNTDIPIDNLSSDVSPTKRKVSVARTRKDTPDNHVDVNNINSTENPSENLSSDASTSSKRKVHEDSTRQDHPDCLVDVNSTFTVNQSRNQSFGMSRKKINETRIRKDTPDSLDVVNSRASKRIEEKDTVSLRKSDPQKVCCISPTSTTSVASSRSLPESNDVGTKSPFISLPESNDVGTKSPFRPRNVILKGEEEPNSVSITNEGNITYSEARNDQRQMNFWQKYCDFEFLTCRLCSAKCADIIALKLHVQEKHDIKFINLQCPICYKAFFAKNLITRHLRRTHKKSSYQTSNLLRQVPGIETRGSDISEFNVDMSSVPEGACPLCNKSFITPHKLTRHMVRFHDKSRGAVRHLLDHAGVLYPTCSLCSKTVLSEYSLERHLERTHGKTREAAKKMLKIDKLKNKLLKEAGTSTPSSSPNLFIQNTDTQVKKQPSPSKRSTDKGRGEEPSDVLIRLCPGCKREFWKFKTFIRHWPFCARKHNLNRYKDLPQAKALRRGKKRTLSFVNSTMSSEMITDSGEKGLISGEQNEDNSLKKIETEWTRSRTAERENRSIPNKVSLVHSRQSISPYSSCSVSNSSSLNRDQALTVSVDVESTLPRPQSCNISSRNRDHASDVSTATEPANSDMPAKPICTDRSKIVVPRTESEAKGCSFKPFIAVTSGIGWRTCAGCKCVFAKARTYQKHIRNCKLIKVKRSSKKPTIRQKVKNDSCWKSRADDNTERKDAERSEKPNNSVGLSSARKSFSHPDSNTPVSGSRDVVQASTSGETNFDETDGMSVIQENFEEMSASEDEDWNTTTQSYNSGNTVHTVEEIWVGKQPGRPVEKIKSNRIYVVDQSRTRKSLCQDQKKINAYIDDSNLRCLQCGMEFSHISNIRRHVIRHLGWKRYKCRMCRFSSYNLSECRMHLYRTHSMEMWHSTSSQVEKFVVNLNKEASKVRTMKKQATLRGKRAQEKYEPSPYSLKIPQNLPGQRSSFRSSQRQLVDRRKPGVNEQNIKNLNCFNISTRNVTRNFDTRPYAPVDRMSTLVTRKGYYPKSSGGSSPSSLSDSQPPATRRARNEDMEFSDHAGMILVSTALPGLDQSISQDLPAIEATSASSLPTLAASIPVENL